MCTNLPPSLACDKSVQKRLLVQFSAGDGPVECRIAVTKIAELFAKTAKHLGISCHVVEQDGGSEKRSAIYYRSVALQCEGPLQPIEKLKSDWQGSLQWICQSPVRTSHKRKNWFIGCDIWEMDHVKSTFDSDLNSIGDIRYEACKAAGPGGQHVNKTDSAIRATHIDSGLSVKVQSERSQHANKRLAFFLICKKLEQQFEQGKAIFANTKHKARKQVERGNPKQVFHGEKFIQKQKS